MTPAIGTTHTIYWHPRWTIDPWWLNVEVIGANDSTVFFRANKGKDSMDIEQWRRAVKI